MHVICFTVLRDTGVQSGKTYKDTLNAEAVCLMQSELNQRLDFSGIFTDSKSDF